MKKQRRSLEIRFLFPEDVAAKTQRYCLLNQQAAILKVGRSSLASQAAAANKRFIQNDCELAKGTKELTLSGFFPYVPDPHGAIYSHPVIQSRWFGAIRPERLRVELHWEHWDLRVLEKLSVANMKVLKLPISLFSDCSDLGRALTSMPRLESLAITGIPDQEEFLAGLGLIGKGILDCASTLRELDLEMTNFNRPATWSGDERFIEPEDVGFFFEKFFPYATAEESAVLSGRYDRNDPDPIIKAPLCLTRLRLKHLSLPWYSFNTIFNAMTIKHIHLPYSIVDGKAWRFLTPHAELESLTEMSYEMLSAEFLHFISEQSSLKELTFVSPQDKYYAKNVTHYGPSLHMVFDVSSEAPRLGSEIVGFPSLHDFLSSLKDMTMLKHLVLPLDMYTMTDRSLKFLAKTLTNLEHLELGFAYDDLVRAATFLSSYNERQ